MTPGEPVEDRDPVQIPIEDSLDLHPFAPRDIPSVVGEYLEQAAARGFREVRLIHGRGTGAQRAVVRRLLRDHPLVASFGDAPPDRGGWGATVVMLKIPPSPPAEIPPPPLSQRGAGGDFAKGGGGGISG
ncbi:MAG TPA: Smr/MutS family protein [Candidatus Sulfotelmatobacter sp.]|nr:Smr/MutS family protein [Candidatus Sulfotelmatobacter sp.]